MTSARLFAVALRVAGIPDNMTIKIKVEEVSDTHSRFTVERDGVTSSGLMPHNPDEDEAEDVTGDPWILQAAAAAYDGESEEWEMTDSELEDQGGGYWSPPR